MYVCFSQLVRNPSHQPQQYAVCVTFFLWILFGFVLGIRMCVCFRQVHSKEVCVCVWKKRRDLCV